MKRTFLICYFCMLAIFLNAQKIYFIYLQTESGKPFFIRMNDKLYSSTASGYLILSKLKDSTYNFKLGFPGKSIDLDFTTSINKKDYGYLIKNFGEKGWGLFDLQSLSIQMSSSNVKGTAQSNSLNQPVNAFTDMLSKATDDPSLKQNPILVKEEEKKPEVVQTIQREEKKPSVTEAVVKEEKKSELIIQPTNKPEEKKAEPVKTNEQKVDSMERNSIIKGEEIYKKSQVTKISGMATIEGFESVFIDEYQNGDKDTVRILIPAENKESIIIKEEPKTDSIEETKKFLDLNPDSTRVIKRPGTETKKEETKKWWPFSKNKDPEANKTKGEEKEEETPKTRIFNNKKASSDKSARETKNGESKKWSLFNKNKRDTTAMKKCQVVAGNDDFLKLRRKMAARTNDDGMLEEAKKYFREKCFTTEQIKNLSSMFLSSAGKYNFFNIALNYVSDKENFSSLQTEFKDEYYVNRFKEMLAN
jgi:hypothetical protein